MAGDWIKMRVSLAKDPRVIAMADHLAGNRSFIDWLCDPVRASCKESAYEHVTRNVTVAVTVSALLQVWGIANEAGKPENEDLLLCHTRIDYLDEVCGVPGFGEAMEFVEWAVEEMDGGKSRVRLPKFLINNTPAEDRAKKANAERQRRFRERNNATGNVESNVTDNVTVTHREEKRREEKEEKQSVPVPATPSTVVPIKPEKPEAEKRKALTFAGWLKTIPDGELAIPADHFVFAQADRAGLPYHFVELEWEWFRWKYSNNPKRYTDWRQTFANAVAGAWGNLWRAVPAGGYELTSHGIQFQRTLEAAA